MTHPPLLCMSLGEMVLHRLCQACQMQSASISRSCSRSCSPVRLQLVLLVGGFRAKPRPSMVGAAGVQVWCHEWDGGQPKLC